MIITREFVVWSFLILVEKYKFGETRNVMTSLNVNPL